MAVPVASAIAAERLGKVADRVVVCAIGSMRDFYVADFYRYWHEPDDDEVVQCLNEWRMRRSRPNSEPLVTQ